MKLKKKVFAFIAILIIILFIFQSYSMGSEAEQIPPETSNLEMKIYSEAAILIESTTGKILYEKNIHEKKYPASTTKILTAIIAIEQCDLNEMATASQYAISSLESGYTKANIQVGESFTIGQLLDVLMLQSANEAATIIAEHISGSVQEFAKLMNKKAQEIGCLNSNFVNPNGVHNENHYSTAYDLAMIARYCMKNETFRSLANKMECTLPRTDLWQDEQVAEHGERNFKNTNNLLLKDNKYYYPYCIGIKAGFTTPAKNCLISASNKDGFETISVILHAELTEDGLSARYLDTINLFEYGYNNYKLNDILEEYDMIEYLENQDEILSSVVTDDSIKEITAPLKINLDWTKIIIGIVIVVIAIIVIFKGKHGKHDEYVAKYLNEKNIGN